MKKISNISYIIICLLLCSLPFIGMTAFRSDTTTENKILAGFPKLKEEGKWNVQYLKGLGTYFEDHFAFRTVLVSADAQIQSKIFGVSNVDTVTVGTDGWLYYTATKADYLGENRLSKREINNAAHNLELLQKYVQDQGAQFLFTVAPNKNSLYGENMPYYYEKKVSGGSNISQLAEAMNELNVSYVDLFEPFQKQPEILYLKRDSHWNKKGAVLVYNTLLNSLEMEHESYETVKAVRTKSEYGDLNKMLYPVWAEPEWNYDYQSKENYSYVTDTKSVEDAWIETENPEEEKSLLMFRDSFGNTLLPLMANAFGKGYFTKSTPYRIEDYMEEYEPELVIAEKVERNIDDFAKEPPIMTGPEVDIEGNAEPAQSQIDLQFSEDETDSNYWRLEGTLPKECQKEDAKVYIRIKQSEEERVYEAFSISNEDTDYGFLLYLPKNSLVQNVQAEVLVEGGKKIQSVCLKEINTETVANPET